MPFIPIIIGGAVVGISAGATWKLLASGAEDAGQAIDAAGSGTLKVVLAAAIGYSVAKFYKVV